MTYEEAVAVKASKRPVYELDGEPYTVLIAPKRAELDFFVDYIRDKTTDPRKYGKDEYVVVGVPVDERKMIFNLGMHFISA